MWWYNFVVGIKRLNSQRNRGRKCRGYPRYGLSYGAAELMAGLIEITAANISKSFLPVVVTAGANGILVTQRLNQI